ncbi:mucin-17-like [Nymphalis io]|uniref:mucin-17-like n=1 Tax=Inachis io TaxID=171585 RepID=UPI00216A3A8D|nr:mucin-17-like [Nymphalis io]
MTDMRKQNKNYCMTKCIMKYIAINIIATGSALSNRPVKFTLDQRPPLSINCDKAITEQEYEHSFKKSDTFNNKDNNYVHLNNYDVIKYNTDAIDDDANRLVNFETNILNNDEPSKYDDSETVFNKNKEKRRDEKESANMNTNFTTIYLAGYDDEIFQIKQELQNKDTSKELLICFYLCNDLHYNDLGCLYTDISILQDVLWKYTHYFCVDNQFLKPTWCLDDIITTYNFPNRKESIDDNALQTKNIKKEVSEAEQDKKVQDTTSNNLNHFNCKPFNISKYYPKIINPNENDLNGSDIDLLKHILKGENITREKDDRRYLNPNNYSKNGCLELDTGNTVNTLEREHNQNCSPLNTGDGNNPIYTNVDYSAEPNIIFETIKNQDFISNINQDKNYDYKPENLKAETLEVIEDSTQNLSDPINSTSTNEANILQYGTNSISLNNIAANTKYTNNTDDGKYNGTFNGFLDDFVNFTESEINKLEPPSVEIIAEDNPLYNKYTAIGTYKPKLDEVSLTAIYNYDRTPQALCNNSQNIFIPSNLKEAEVTFRQPEYSVKKYPNQPSDTTKRSNEDQTENLLENNAQNKHLNILVTNAPYMYNFINKQSTNLKSHIRCHINHSDLGVSICPISDPKTNIALVRLPSTYFKLNRRTEDLLTSLVNEKNPPLSGLGNKQHYSSEKSTLDLILSDKLKLPIKFSITKEERENRVPSYQNSDAKNDQIKKVDVRISPQIWRKSPTVIEYNSLPMVYYPEPDNGVFAQSNNKIKPLYEYYKCSITQDTLEKFKNNVYLDTQRTNMKDLIKWNYLKNPPYKSIVKKITQSFSKNINDTQNIDYSTYNSGKYDRAEPIISKINMFESNNKPVSQIERKVLPVDSKMEYRQNHETILGSSTLPNFYPIDPTLPYKPLVTSPYSVLKNNIDVPTILSWHSPCTINKALKTNSLDFEQVTSDLLKTKKGLNKIPKTSAAIDFIPSSYPTKCFSSSNLGMISTDPILCQLQNQQYSNVSESRKNVLPNSISYANSKKVNLVSELSYSLPLASVYDRSNKKKLKFPDYVTSVISSLNFKSLQKTSIMLPNKNDLGFPLNVLSPFGLPFSRSYPPRKSVLIVSSLYDYMEMYDLFSQYRFPCTNSLLVKSLEDKIYPYYYIKPNIRYIPNYLKTSLKAPINNTRLVAPTPSPLTTGLSSKGIPDHLSSLPTSSNKDLSSTVFPFPMSSLPISSNKVLPTNSLPIPISTRPNLSTLERGRISFPAPVQSSPIYSNIDRRLNDYSIPNSSLQPSSNVSSKLFHPPISFFTSPCTDFKSKGTPFHPIPLPILMNKEIGTNSVPIPIASLSTSSWPISSTIDRGPKTISAPIKFLPVPSKLDLRPKGFPLPTSSLPISSNKELGTLFPLPISSLPVSSCLISPPSQPRPKNFVAPFHFLPISFTTDYRSKGFPSSTSSLPITSKLDQNLKGPIHSLPITSNEDFNLKSLPASSFLPVSSNKDSSSKSFLFFMPSLPITSNKKEGTKRLPIPISSLTISSAIDRGPETFPMSIQSLPCSNLNRSIKGSFPNISSSISPSSYCKTLPFLSNLGLCLKSFPAPIYSLSFSSPQEVIPKTITSPVLNSYQFPLSSLPILSNKEVDTKSPPTPVSSPYPFVSTLEIKPKIHRKPILSLPISSNKDLNLKGFSTPVLSLPISSPLKAVAKSITSRVLSLPFMPTIAKNNILEYAKMNKSSLHIPSTLEIGSKSFLQSVPSFPSSSDIEFQPRYITPSFLPLPVSSNLEFQPKYLSEHIQSLPYLSNSSNVDLNSKVFQSPVSYLPFSLNKDFSLKDFSPTNLSRPVTTPEKVFAAPIQDFPIALNLYLNSKGFSPSILSTSEHKPKTFPKPYQVLPVSLNINPCLKDLPIPIICDTIPSTSEIKSKSFHPLPSLPFSSAIKFQLKSIPRHIQSSPISPNKGLNLKYFLPTKLSWLFPSTLNIMPKTLTTLNQSMPILSNNINWKEFPYCISLSPTSSPLEFKPNILPGPNSSNVHPCLKGYSCPVSPLPVVSNQNLNLKSFRKHISPHFTLPMLKSIGSISSFNLSNASTLQEPYQTEKNQPILAEIRSYSQNDMYDTRRNISYFTNFRPTSTPTSQEVNLVDPASYQIISNKPLYQPFNPNFFSSKVINGAHSKALKTQDNVINPVPYLSISNHRPSEIISNSFSNPYEQKTVQYYPNFKSMPKPQSAVLNNALPNSFTGNLPSVYPFKAKPKTIFPFNEPKIQSKTYSYIPFQSDQEIEKLPLINNAVYLDSQSPKSTLNYHTHNPQSRSNLLQNSSSQSKLKSIYLPTRSNLNNLHPSFKSTITTVPISHSVTEEDRIYTTCNLQKYLSHTQHDLQPILGTTEYPSDIYTPTFASKFEPIDSKTKLTSTLQSLLPAPSHYKEKLIKFSPYKSKLPIQSSNEEFIPESLSYRNTQTKFDRKYPQYPTEINSPIQRNLHRITDTEVSKSFNKIEHIYPKSSSCCVHENFRNKNNSINQTLNHYINKYGVIIPIDIIKYEPNNLNKFNIKSNNPDIELKAWISKLKFLKPKIVLDEVEYTAINFIPIVKDIARYTPEIIQDTVKSYVQKYYGKPIVLKRIYSFCQHYDIDVTKKTGTIYIICNNVWPTHEDS